jgi:hypothetical protein
VYQRLRRGVDDLTSEHRSLKEEVDEVNKCAAAFLHAQKNLNERTYKFIRRAMEAEAALIVTNGGVVGGVGVGVGVGVGEGGDNGGDENDDSSVDTSQSYNVSPTTLDALQSMAMRLQTLETLNLRNNQSLRAVKTHLTKMERDALPSVTEHLQKMAAAMQRQAACKKNLASLTANAKHR